MGSDTITFQLGTQYLSRTALRVERLLYAIKQAAIEPLPVTHRAALCNLFELINLTQKPELKGRFLQAFLRILHATNQHVLTLPEQMREALSESIQALSNLASTFGEDIHQDAFLQAITSAAATHHGEGDLYAPQLIYWLENKSKTRQQDLSRWLEKFNCLEKVTNLYLSILRNTAEFKSVMPKSGFYQCPVSQHHKNTCHLVLVRMNKNSQLIPKMQVGNHGLSIKLCEAKSMQEVQENNTPIELSICTL